MKRRQAASIALAAVTAIAALLDYQPGRRLLFARAAAQHASPVGPSQIRPEIDNEAMLVLRVRLAPHERTPMHDVSPRLVVWLTDAHLRDTAEDGTTTDYRRSPGAVEWVSARRHAGENLGDGPIEFLAILPKPARSTPDAAHRARP
jgi:quercetin dioxygenase-like cupin family protein